MTRPRVLVLADQPGWAWHYKALQYRRWLGGDVGETGEFDVEVGYRAHYYRGAEPDWLSYDLVHTFEFPQVDQVPELYRGRVLTGLTANVWRTWGEARVRAWASRAWALHANSRQLLEEISPFAARVYYTPNGVDEEFWRPPELEEDRRPDAVVFCHVGKPKAHKGYPVVQALCDDIGAPIVTCYRTAHDPLTPFQIRDLYWRSHVQVVYSTKDGTPCVALEAAACGNAVVANDIGNMPEFVRHLWNGYHLRERAPEALCEAIRWCRAAGPDVLRLFGQRARDLVVREWTWRRQCERVRALWRDALAGRPRAHPASMEDENSVPPVGGVG